MVKFDRYHCPKCGRRVRKHVNAYSCRCGWSFVEMESNLVRRFLYGW